MNENAHRNQEWHKAEKDNIYFKQSGTKRRDKGTRQIMEKHIPKQKIHVTVKTENYKARTEKMEQEELRIKTIIET